MGLAVPASSNACRSFAFFFIRRNQSSPDIATKTKKPITMTEIKLLVACLLDRIFTKIISPARTGMRDAISSFFRRRRAINSDSFL